MQKDEGRPHYVYCGWRPKALLEAYRITKLAVSYCNEEWTRGDELPRKADAIINGQNYLEFESSELTYARFENKLWRNYRDFDGTLLIVTLTEARRDGLIELCASMPNIAEIARLAAFDDIRSNPFGPVWRTTTGTPWCMPEQYSKTS